MRQARVAPRGFLAHGRFSLPAQAESQLEVRSAANLDDVIAVFPIGAGDASTAVASAAQARRAWQSMHLQGRIELVARIEKPLVQRFGELSVRMQRELGRAPWECQRELSGLVPRLHDLVSVGKSELASRDSQRACPLGVVAVIGPAMLPLGTSHGTILAALIAGNTVVWKPSPLGAASAQLYAEALLAAGLPAGVFNLVQGDETVGKRLLTDARVNAVVFTGSREHALEVRRACSDRLDLTLLVHAGSKNPAVVLESADLKLAAAEIAQAGFLSSGQRCTALSRVLVQSSILEPFLGELLAVTGRLEGPGPRSLLGPMFSQARLEGFCAAIADAEKAGALPILPSQVRSLYVSPSIHLVEEPSPYLERELFGPDLAVEPIHDLNDALIRLRGGALYASLFSDDEMEWQAFNTGLDAGAMLRNHSPVAVSGRLSFAAPGRESGLRGPRAIAALTRSAAICHSPTGLALPIDLPVEEDHTPIRAGGRS